MRLLGLCFLLFSLPALATQYWVRPGSSNYGTGDGLSYANALGSATSFFSTVGTGDDVYLCGTITAGFTIGDNGVDANNYQIYDGSCPVGDGTYDPVIFTHTSGYGINTSGKKYTRVQNIRTQGGAAVRLQSTTSLPCHGCQVINVTCESGTGAALSCVRIEGPVATGNLTVPATDVLIEDVTCTEPSAHCAAIMEYAINPVMRNCRSYGGGDGANVWMCYIKPPSEAETSWTLSSGTVYTATVANTADIAKVISSGVHSTNKYYMTENDGATTGIGAGEWDQSGTTLYVNNGVGNPGTIYVVYAQTAGAVIENSLATDASATYDGVGIGIDYGAINGFLRRNVSYGNPGSGFELGLGDGHTAEGNIAWGNGKYGLRVSWPESAATIKNNTFANNTLGGIDIFRAQNGVTVTANNNALIGVGSGDNGFSFTETLYATVTEDFNNVADFATARESGISAGANSISAYPQFIEGQSPTTAEGFKPYCLTSPLKDAGTNVGAVQDYTGRYFVGTPEIGAYACQGGTSRSGATNRATLTSRTNKTSRADNNNSR